MKNKTLLDRIIIDPQIMTGKPVVKGTRVTVQSVLGLMSQGLGYEEVLQEYPQLKREDIFACLLFAQNAIADATFISLEQ